MTLHGLFAHRRTSFLVAVMAMTMLVGPSIHGQSTFASLVGTVTDPNDAVIVGVEIKVTNTETNLTFEGVTNAVGDYRIERLPRGSYEVRALMQGFQEALVRDILLEANDVRRVDLRMEVGTVTTTVEVKGRGGATLIETETMRIGDIRTETHTEMLPIPGRSMWNFLLLTPGVMYLERQEGDRSRGLSFAGSRSNQRGHTIDGTTVEDGLGGSIGPLANFVESYQEFKVELANNTAEYGALARTSIISKAGTNRLHGSLFDYYVTPWFRARESFATQRAGGVSHRLGGSVAGPVYVPSIYKGKDKTFFFFSWETDRQSELTQNLNPTVPLEPWRRGDFSGLGTPIIDPQTGAPFPGNQIPADRISSVSEKLQDRFYPLPNFGDPTLFRTRNYRETVVRPPQIPNYVVTRVDHRIGERDDLSGRFTFHRQRLTNWEGNLPTMGPRRQIRNNRAVNFTWAHTFSPTLINEFRFGHSRNTNPRIGPINGPPLVQELGLQGLAPTIPTDPDFGGILRLSWSGIALQGLSQLNTNVPGFENKVYTFYDAVSWHRGRHNLKFGTLLLHASLDNANAQSALFGDVSFGGDFTGHPYADFLLGIPDTARRAFGVQQELLRRPAYNFFFQDDFKIHRRLTLNLGIRYELHPSWSERDKLFSTFDPTSGKIVVPDAVFGTSVISPFMPTGYIDIIRASEAGFPQRLIQNDTNNFAPRVGFAWRPFAEPTTVVRGGYGIFYDTTPRQPPTDTVPYTISEPAFTNPSSPTLFFPQVFPSTGTGGPSTASIPAAFAPDSVAPYSQQWNVTIEHQRWNAGFRLSYIGTSTRKMLYSRNINQPVPDDRPFIEKPRPFPRFPAINRTENGGNHQYHALMLEVERKFSNGLYYQSALTWARDIGDAFDPENAFDRARERGPNMSIPNLRWGTNFIWELPVGKGKRFASGSSRALDLAIGGWAISGIATFQTGQHLTVLNRARDVTGTAFTASKTPARVTYRPDRTADGNLSSNQRTVDRYFDTSAFAPVPSGAGRFGNAGRGIIVGPGANLWSLGIFKTFRFNERVWLRWELTSNNTFNHPNYRNPGTRLDSGSFGEISSAGGLNTRSSGDNAGPRAFRMGLRLEF